MNDYQRGELLGATRTALAQLRVANREQPSRPLSLAITKVEEAVHWLQDPSIIDAVNEREERP